MNRRTFIKGILAYTSLFTLSFPFSCSAERDKDEMLWYALGEALFPCDEPGAPCIKNIGFLHHLHSTLKDKNYDPDIRAFIRQGFIQFKRYLQDRKIDFVSANDNEKERIIRNFIQSEGDNWIYRLNVLLIESTFLDPYYGVNFNKTGWKWTYHTPGTPRPVAGHDYKSLLRKRKISEIITKI